LWRSPWGDVGRGQDTPGEQGSNLGVRHDITPTSINSPVKGSTLVPVIWSYDRTK
jgi:hypothetical protein